MSDLKPENQRYAPRFKHRCYVTLRQTSEQWDAHLINISSTGVLVAIINNTIEEGTLLDLEVELKDARHILLKGLVAHTKDHYVGIECSAETLGEREKLETLITTFEDEDRV
ncbi:MAG: hypothetical protein ACI93R_000038 [Flavobacteriales bacterium]|jgi:hypothetical protein